MKRIKSLLAGLCTLALVVAFGVGSFGYVPAAFAAPADEIQEAESIDTADTLDIAPVAHSYNLYIL